MRTAGKPFLGTAIAFAATSAVIGLVLAEAVPAAAPAPATAGDPRTTIPEKMLLPGEGETPLARS